MNMRRQKPLRESPDDILVIYDVRHNVGLDLRNRPLIRTMVAFAIGVLVAWLVSEILFFYESEEFSPSQATLRLLVSLVAPFMVAFVVAYGYDYRECAKCGFSNGQWSSLLCNDCWDDYALDDAEYIAKAVMRLAWRGGGLQSGRDEVRERIGEARRIPGGM